MTEIFTLWVGATNPICRLCMLSWKKLNYKINVYTDLNDFDPWLQQFQLFDYKDILQGSTQEILPFSDLFRYKKLYRDGGTWVDADMFLLKPIPHCDYLITSERTAQTGAFKRQIKSIPNIGVLRFPPKCSLLKYVIDKIERSKSKSKKCTKNMFVFQDAILKTYPTWLEEVAPPEDYCPVNWSNIKEQYYGKEFKSKYGQEVNQIDYIFEKSIGVHLWENLSLNKYKIDFEKTKEGSLWNLLKNHIDS